MSQPDAVLEHYAAQQRQVEATAILARRQWRRMSVDDIDGSWVKVVDRLAFVVASGQLGAARAGAAYVPAVLGADSPADASVAAQRLAGIASDGRPLDTLLYAAVIRAREALSRTTPVSAMASGADHLDLLVRTQVADAGRAAASVAITARPRVGYVRMVSPPCCQRCAVLAGKTFRWNDGFKRHPRCQCRHTPVEEGNPLGYSSDIEPAQIRDLTEAQRQAISDGADVAQVINAHRGRNSGGMTTTEGTTRRGLAGQRGVRRRLTPDAIYRVSATREEAVERLRANGYLI